MATIEALITAEEFFAMPADGTISELVRGRIVTMSPPWQPHGLVCLEVGGILRDYLKVHRIGRAVGNDSTFITRRNPDSVRGPDVSVYRNDQIPQDRLERRWDAVPPLVCEVLSPSKTWPAMLEKVAEYLQAGVEIACIFDPDSRSVEVFRANRRPETLTGDMELKLPEILGEAFSVPVNQFFE